MISLLLSKISLKQIVIVVILACLAFLYGSQQIKINHYKNEVENITTKYNKQVEMNKTLKDNETKLLGVVQDNNNTITSLTKERNDALESVKKLNNANKKVKQDYLKLSQDIEKAKNTKDDGNVSVILKQTIETIQNKRGQ